MHCVACVKAIIAKKRMKQIGPVVVEKNAKKCKNKTAIGQSLNLAQCGFVLEVAASLLKIKKIFM